MKKDAIKILTYNIHKGFSTGNRRFILHELRDALRQVNPDIVFLQEIQGEHKDRQQSVSNWPSGSQFEFLADEVWHHHAYGKNAIYPSGHHGNAILSKFPFSHWENINVSLMRTASRSLLHGVIDCPERETPLHVICVHLGLFKIERDKQLQTLVTRINEHVPIDESVILAGDFNDWRGHAEEYLTTQLGLQEVFKHKTGSHARSYPSWMPTLPMDRIYYRGLEAHQFHRLHADHWKKLSDHTPLMAHFRFAEQS